MTITLTDSLLLAAAIGVIALGFVSRRVATAGVARTFTKDRNDKRHFEHAKQTLILRKRLGVLTAMLTFSALGLLSAFTAVALSAFDMGGAASIAFLVAVALIAISLFQALYESALSNRSLYMEIDATVSADDPYYKGNGA